MSDATFTAEKPSRARIRHTLRGYWLDDEHDEDEQWEAVVEFKAMVPFHTLNGLMKSFGAVDGQLTANSMDLEKFMLDACTSTGREVLSELLRSDEKAVDVKLIAQVAMDLVGRYTGTQRPTIG